jgi:hypothetical protein
VIREDNYKQQIRRVEDFLAQSIDGATKRCVFCSAAGGIEEAHDPKCFTIVFAQAHETLGKLDNGILEGGLSTVSEVERLPVGGEPVLLNLRSKGATVKPALAVECTGDICCAVMNVMGNLENTLRARPDLATEDHDGYVSILNDLSDLQDALPLLSSLACEDCAKDWQETARKRHEKGKETLAAVEASKHAGEAPSPEEGAPGRG